MAPKAEKGSGGASRKPRYEPPVLMPLGATAKGEAVTCSVGAGASGGGLGYCQTGRAARGQCRDGQGR